MLPTGEINDTHLSAARSQTEDGLKQPNDLAIGEARAFSAVPSVIAGAVGYDGDAVDEWIRNRPLVRRQAAEAS